MRTAGGGAYSWSAMWNLNQQCKNIPRYVNAGKSGSGEAVALCGGGLWFGTILVTLKHLRGVPGVCSLVV